MIKLAITKWGKQGHFKPFNHTWVDKQAGRWIDPRTHWRGWTPVITTQIVTKKTQKDTRYSTRWHRKYLLWNKSAQFYNFDSLSIVNRSVGKFHCKAAVLISLIRSLASCKEFYCSILFFSYRFQFLSDFHDNKDFLISFKIISSRFSSLSLLVWLWKFCL